MRAYQSRLSRVEERKNIRSAIIFGGLTIAVIVFIFVFGIPAFSKFVNFFNKNTSNISQNQDERVILAPPNIDTLPRYVKDKTLTIKGNAQSNSMIKIYFNNSSDETVSDDSGNFSANIELNKGVNIIYATTVDSKGNESKPTEKFSISYLSEAPNLTISRPQNNQNFYGEAQKNIIVEGLTDIGNSVSVNDHIAIVESDGKFSITLGLNDGDNEIKVVSTDPAGNKKEITLKVRYNP